jgi:hypothetical protein
MHELSVCEIEEVNGGGIITFLAKQLFKKAINQESCAAHH